MKTLTNHTLLYDTDCPLCNLYTDGFIKTNMLDNNGRKPFNQLNENEQNFVDIKRATNEIALVDTKNKTVIYGIDSLLKVIGNSFPFIETFGNVKPIKFVLKKSYSFISYNRKVIIPSKNNREIKLQCVPDFNYRYRFMYILFATMITTLVLFQFSNIITVLPESSITREFILVFGQVVFQSLFLIKLNNKALLNYMGNLMTVSLMGSIILIPLVILHSFVHLSQITLLIGFGITVLLMFFEHYRRVNLLELPFRLNNTWVLYGSIVLAFILNF